MDTALHQETLHLPAVERRHESRQQVGFIGDSCVGDGFIISFALHVADQCRGLTIEDPEVGREGEVPVDDDPCGVSTSGYPGCQPGIIHDGGTAPHEYSRFLAAPEVYEPIGGGRGYA
jgi:hypothetical protein